MTATAFNVLVIGSGGREHAIVWKLLKSPRVAHVFIAPGNGGTASMDRKRVTNLDIKVSDFDSLLQFAANHSVELAVVGPEQPLVDGIADKFRKIGVSCFGPSAHAAMLEGSKAFSKSFMDTHGIPTAAYRVFTDHELALEYLRSHYFSPSTSSLSSGVVIKASGLAAGKGVLLPRSLEEAETALRAIMLDREFGGAGSECIIEDLLQGDECSVLAFTDGHSIRVLPPAQDHKRVSDGDLGPNTGGMGAYAPAPVASSPAMMERIERTVLRPVVDGMRKSGHPFVGVLYAGLMVNAVDGSINVLEFNCRFGDPETQVLVPLLSDDTDLAEVMLACANGCLDSVHIGFRSGFAATVVAAAGGYPGAYAKGDAITLGQTGKDSLVFHAGTAVEDRDVVTNGGRVLAVTGCGHSLKEALDNAYGTMSSISFKGMHYRRDIGHRALSQQPPPSSANGVSYADAGVSIDAGNHLVDEIKAVVRGTSRPGASAEIGGFGGLFDLKAGGYDNGNTMLVAATDGVGTKLKIAHMMGKHDTIGIDLVAMNVNDLIVQGAEPLLFLDYFACGKLDVRIASEVVRGIAAGCKLANCALVGGETAEMPGMYTGEDYDLAGFTVGAVDKSLSLPLTDKILAGDALIGIASSGVHSNGYSLVRHLVKKSGLDYHSPCPFTSDGSKLGDSLLTPTRIYVRSVMEVVRKRFGLIKGMAHITGGGFIDNIPRVLPEHLGAVLDASKWPLPAVFKWLRGVGGLSTHEMSRTFNCGIGMVLVVAAAEAEECLKLLKEAGETESYLIGKLVPVQQVDAGDETVKVLNADSAWK